jgi:hypothetical protein
MAYKELQRVAVGNRPEGTLYNSGSIWCANIFDTTVSRVNPSTGAVIATITFAENPTSITQDGFGNVWVSCAASSIGTNYGLQRINPATNTVDQQLEYRITYNGVSFADGDLIASRFAGGGVTSRVDPTTFAFTNISKAAPAGYSDGPRTAAYDGTLLWLTNYGNDAVYGLDSSNAYVSTITAVTDPQQCVYAFGYLWVCSRGGAGIGFWRVNVLTNATTRVITTGISGVTFDANYLYVTGSSSVVQRVDPSTLAVSALYTDTIATAIFDPVMDGSTIWFSAVNTDELVQIGELAVGWVRGHAWG